MLQLSKAEPSAAVEEAEGSSSYMLAYRLVKNCSLIIGDTAHLTDPSKPNDPSYA